ncbi:MAG: glycosyltransferase family 9 protein [Nitrospinota bacterium]
MKLLIVKISSLGDVIHGFAVAKELKAQRPDITIDWLVGDVYAELVEHQPAVRKVWRFRRGQWGGNWRKPSTWSEIAALMSSIRSERYDVCLDLQGLLRSGLITLFSGAKKRVGYHKAREGGRLCYDVRLESGESEHAVDILSRSLTFFDAEIPENPAFKFDIPGEAVDGVKKLLAEFGISGPPGQNAMAAQAGKYMVFHPGARWDTKKWPKGRWSELADSLSKSASLPVIFTGSGGESGIINEIINGRINLFNAAGRLTLLELSALLRDAELIVTVDSGPMHMAAAFSTPVVALFGPTSTAKTGPRSAGPVDMVTARYDCAPCFKRDCNMRPNCMDAITAAEVEQKVLALLE